MLTPEDLEHLKPEFEEIVWHLRVVLDPELNDGLSEDEVAGYGTRGIALMEDLVEKVRERQGGRSIRDILGNVRPEERAGIIGAMAGVIASLSATGLGGFGVAAGGTAAGVAGLAGATVASGGVALGAGAAFYLAYKTGASAKGSKAWETGRRRLGRFLGTLGDRIEGEDDAGQPARL